MACGALSFLNRDTQAWFDTLPRLDEEELKGVQTPGEPLERVEVDAVRGAKTRRGTRGGS